MFTFKQCSNLRYLSLRKPVFLSFLQRWFKDTHPGLLQDFCKLGSGLQLMGVLLAIRKKHPFCVLCQQDLQPWPTTSFLSFRGQPKDRWPLSFRVHITRKTLGVVSLFFCLGICILSVDFFLALIGGLDSMNVVDTIGIYLYRYLFITG